MGGGEGGGYTTLLNNCGARQIKNSKSIHRRYRILALSALKKFIFLRSIRGTKKRRRYFPAVNLEELIDRRQSLGAGYCQGAVVILIYNELVISYSPLTELVLGPACPSLPDGP